MVVEATTVCHDNEAADNRTNLKLGTTNSSYSYSMPSYKLLCSKKAWPNSAAEILTAATASKARKFSAEDSDSVLDRPYQKIGFTISSITILITTV